MSIVYVVQEPAQIPRLHGHGTRPKIDLSPAQRYGSLRYLLEWSETKDLDPEDMQAILRTRLKEYSPEDYILAIGSPVAMAMATCLAAQRAGGRVNMLVWSRETGYTVIPFTLGTGERDE